MEPGSSIRKRVEILRQQIPAHVKLIAVSKQVPPDKMREAYAAGIRDFGESRVQEAISKHLQLQDLPNITWHFIGRLQANKARKVLENFQWIHSVDSLALTERLNQLANEMQRSPQVCLQVKLSPDPSKQGWSEDQLWADLPRMSQFRYLNFKGLMMIPPRDLPETDLRALFQKSQNLLHRIQSLDMSHLQLSDLSMGMSDDFLLAIENGSTMVRLGRILFGDRG